MEKRVLLAFVLSFLVLLTWGRLNPTTVLPTPAEKKSQTIVNKDFIKKSDTNFRSPAQESSGQVSPAEKKTELLENSKIEVRFSNTGGSIESLRLKQYGASLPITGIFGLQGYGDKEFILVSLAPREIVYAYEDQTIKIVKKYRLGEDYLIFPTIEITNNEMSRKATQGAFILDISRLDKNTEKSRDKGLFEYVIASNKQIYRKANAYKLSKKEERSEEEGIRWVGFRDRYFCFIIRSGEKTSSYSVKVLKENELGIFVQSEADETSSGKKIYSAEIFFGPQDSRILKQYNQGYEQIMKFSNIGIFDFAANIVYKLLNFLYKILKNWGICIILTAILVYAAMYPLSMKGMMSMKKMQALQPEIVKLKEQYKNNPQRLQKETMELYKEHKINPLGGCLPLILQMPFFIGVYQVLWRNVAFKNSKFLWIKDLSEPDRVFHFPVSLPIVGEYLNILPVFMIILMALQQRLSSKNTIITDPAQQSSQKMMMIIFPLMIGFVFYNIASGLSLYFTTFYLLSTLTQWRISHNAKAC